MSELITEPKIIKSVQKSLEGGNKHDDVGWSYIKRKGVPLRRTLDDETPIRKVNVGDEVFVYVLYMGFCKGVVIESGDGKPAVETSGCVCSLEYDEEEGWGTYAAWNKKAVCKVIVRKEES